MPPRKSTQAANKRAHEADDNQRASKSAGTNDAPTEEQAEQVNDPQGSRKRRISKGPKGEALMPQFMPRDRKWWEDYGPWLEANKKALKLTASKWKMRDEAMKQDNTVPDDEGADDWDFDEDDEDGDDEGDEDEDKEDEGADKNREKKPYDKLASLHPDWPWSFTMRGIDRFTWLQLEALKRDQDDFDLHIYNDFTGYGMHEVMENAFAQFDSVFKPKASYRDTWPEVEGIAMVLRSGLIEYAMCDDPEKCESISEMVGYLTLATIDPLKAQDVFKPDSEIRNLGTVLFMLVIGLAEEAGIQLAAPHNFDKSYNEIMENRDQRAKKMNIWNSHIGGAGAKLGGQRFDITTFTKAERKKHSIAPGGGWNLM
ncbi:hypothetical protein FGRMN_1680 [Fusarium graminum]|nr:hypothetical protein FGRMN_1680 [Fusarium graminum]